MSLTEITVLTDVDVATMAGPADFGLIHDAALVLTGAQVTWLGPRAELPDDLRAVRRDSCGGGLITPGLVECSAQLIFGGDGRDDFATRAAGAPADLASGILTTVAATRASTDDELLADALRRAWWFIRQGVTTLEVKTGYGLFPDAELRLLRVAERLRAALPITVRITLLAGHTYPPDVDHEDYVIDVCDTLLPAAIAMGVLDQVEVYCEEEGGISMEDASTILETVYRKKIPTRVAADHLSDSAGGALAPAFYSKVAAYVNFTDDIAVKAMGKAGTTAVLMPGSALELGAAGQRPPVDLLHDNHVPIAVSTGFDPWTSPLADLRTAAHLACLFFGLSPAEAVHGITSTAARALALADGTGRLVAGGPADFAVWDLDHPVELAYWLGAPVCREVWARGKRVAALS